MKKGSVSINHPFTPSAVGIPEEDIPIFHSQPHVKAMEMLADEGFECKMEYFSDKLFPYTVNGNKLRWIFWPVSKRWNSDHKKWKKQYSFFELIRYLLRTPDVTIINMSGHSSPYSMLLARLILMKGKKYIAMLGGQHLTLDKSRIEYYHKSDHILVHTELQKQTMKSMEEFTNCRIDTFPLGVDCDKFIPTESRSFDSPSLLYIGRIIDWKRIHFGIEALALLHKSRYNSAKFKIIGPVSSISYYNKLKQLVQERGLSDYVTFVGFVEHKKLLDYYHWANLFVLPSDHETFGMVMIESMACGVPVAAIDCPGGPKDVIRNGYDGILSSVESYTADVLNIFRDPAALEELSKNARKTVLNKYSIQASYEVLKRSVNRCLRLEK